MPFSSVSIAPTSEKRKDHRRSDYGHCENALSAQTVPVTFAHLRSHPSQQPHRLHSSSLRRFEDHPFPLQYSSWGKHHQRPEGTEDTC